MQRVIPADQLPFPSVIYGSYEQHTPESVQTNAAVLSDRNEVVIPTATAAGFGRFYPFGADRLTSSGCFIRGKPVALTHTDASSMTARCDLLR